MRARLLIITVLLSIAATGADAGYGIDPDGRTVATGCHLDPNGCPGSNQDSGPGMDPNG